MVNTEVEASTFNEYQVSKFTQVAHQGYCYFPFQRHPEIASKSFGVFWSTAIPINYLYSLNREPESATAVFTSNIGQIVLTSSTEESICEQIILPIIQQTFYYHNIFDIVSTDTTQISSSDPKIEQSVINLFDAYQHEDFDTDIAFEFTDALNGLIRANGKPVVNIINNLIKKLDLNKHIISETLKSLGRIEDENTEEERYQLLMCLITDDSVIIRDGAVSGLSFLDDRRALPQLRMLLETETIPILKNNIKVAIKGLEY